jgi:peptide/nickel transport system permease protein
MSVQESRSSTGGTAAHRAAAPRGTSLTSIAWQQFRKHPMARLALAVLGVLYVTSAFADFFAPYPERYINARASFQPPNTIRWRDEGGFSRPFIYAMAKELDLNTFETIWTEERSQKYYIDLFVRREGQRELYVPFPVNLIPIALRQRIGLRPWENLHLFGLRDAPDNVRLYLWGSDDLGGDMFSKILFGGRISLTIGILASAVAVVLGLLMGGISGYFGGWIDELIMRFIEALSAIPGLFLLLTLSAVFYPLNLPSSVVFPLIVVVLATIGWGGVARTVRGQILSIRERDFTQAARALGASDSRIITRHLLPQTLSFVIVNLSLSIPAFIITEAVLSFFGLGIQPPSTSWGLMLSTAQAFAGVTGLTERWWIYLPGLFIFLSVLTWNLLGDGLRDAFDPRTRR